MMLVITGLVIYILISVAPVKALCSEKYQDWVDKFSRLGINCLEVTGDFDNLDFNDIKQYQLILTTPEKWDSLTRRWKDHSVIVQQIKLFLIDEVIVGNIDSLVKKFHLMNKFNIL